MWAVMPPAGEWSHWGAGAAILKPQFLLYSSFGMAARALLSLSQSLCP